MLPGVAIFGNSTLSHVLINYFREYGFKVEAFWCPNDDDGHKIRNVLSIPYYSNNIDKVILLPNVQLIVIASVPHYHSQIASKACRIGKHVICNWPPTYTAEEMIAMRTAATNYPSLITLFYTTLRFIPAYHLMRKLVLDDQVIGTIKLINATVNCDSGSLHKEKSVIWDKDLGAGLLSMFGCNLIDVITYITSLKACRVHGIVRSFGQVDDNPVLANNADDFVTFQMELNNSTKSEYSAIKQKESIIANITLNGYQFNQYPYHEFFVYGTNGYLVCRDNNLYACLNNCPKNIKTNIGLDLQFDLLEENIIYKDNSLNGMTIKSHVFPQLYLRGINEMVCALKNAFSGEKFSNHIDESIKSQIEQKIYKDENNLPNNNNNNHVNRNKSLTVGQLHVDNINNVDVVDEDDEEIYWAKEPVSHAANFDDGLYIQSVIEAIRMSSDQKRSILIPVYD